MSYDRHDEHKEWLQLGEEIALEERVARALCWKNGMNPDLTLGGDGKNFLWHEYIPQAKTAIEVCREFMK